MKLLLDTHVVLWVANSPQRLPRTARDMIASLDNEVYFSVVNVWEVVQSPRDLRHSQRVAFDRQWTLDSLNAINSP
jgi:PIN domain nuclease of toxin-antitoxin system